MINISVILISVLLLFEGTTSKMKQQILTVLVLTLSSVSHRTKLCWATEVHLCKAVWEPRVATSNSSCEPVCDLKLGNLTANCSAAWPKPCCLWVQLLSPVLTPPYSCNNVVDKESRAVTKERYETTSDKV